MRTGIEQIRYAMRRHKLNQKQVAEQLEISEGYLSKILANTAPISPHVAVRLEALGIDGRKMLLDQTLIEYERAKQEYRQGVGA